MTRQDDSQQNGSTLHDTPSGYGWISIVLHWSTAVVVIALWFIGRSIMASDGVFADERRSLHVSLAASAWLLVAFRIAWRFREGHPRVRGQTARIHGIAKATHYATLAAVLAMLLSGPLMVWARGACVSAFGLVTLPAPFEASESFADALFDVHATAAALLFVLVVLHIGGALKHLMFHNDDTIVRMLWPGRRGADEESP